jgi:predicted small lipoprotein YifL
MRNLLFALLLVPCCTTLTVGCGDKKPEVIEPAPVDAAAEGAETDADSETTE